MPHCQMDQESLVSDDSINQHHKYHLFLKVNEVCHNAYHHKTSYCNAEFFLSVQTYSYSQYSSRRNSNHAVHLDFFFHQNIQNTCRIHSSHGTASRTSPVFTSFMICLSFQPYTLKELFFIFLRNKAIIPRFMKNIKAITFSYCSSKKCQRISFGMNKVHKHVRTHNCYIFFL